MGPDVAWGLGLAGVWAWLVLSAKPVGAEHPYEAPRPALPGREPTFTWLRLAGDRLVLFAGVRYRGCVRLPWYAPKSAVRSRLRQGLLEKGFVDVEIAEGAGAAGWPPIECDFYVEATWGRPAEELDVPSAVALAWWRHVA